MPAPKGHPRYGGRSKGTPNRASLPLLERAKALGCDPFDALIWFASGNYKALGYETNVIDANMRILAIREAMKYTYPQRKALDEPLAPNSGDVNQALKKQIQGLLVPQK